MRIRPSKIQLTASTVCQLKCPTCCTSEGRTAKYFGSQTLEFRNFKNLVDANPWVRQIELAGEGEIFLNRDLLKIMKYAYEKKVVLTGGTGSNLNTVSEETLEGLVKYQFDFLSCSIDGASSEIYKIYRRGGDFEKVIANIKKINAFKVKYRSAVPVLQWQFVLFGHNEQEILRARKMARKLGMKFKVALAWGDFSPVRNKNFVKKATGLLVTSRGEYLEGYGKVYLSGMCSQMWIKPQINSDGRVFGCCVNSWGAYGNAFKKDLMGILNGKKMMYTRAMLRGREKERGDIPCIQCPLYREMKRTNSWFFLRKKRSHARVNKQTVN